MGNDAALMAPSQNFYEPPLGYGTIMIESERSRRRRSRENSPAWQCLTFTAAFGILVWFVYTLCNSYEPYPQHPGFEPGHSWP
jgi:hypothetical protein